MNWLKRIYATASSHATKLLGIVGAAFMALVDIDTEAVHTAAQLYLSARAVKYVGVFLFLLVIARGFYTGWKAKQK